jgi:hypothetical protein
VVSAGFDGAVRSWRLDGRPGPLERERAHDGPIGALALVEHDGAPLVASAGGDGDGDGDGAIIMHSHPAVDHPAAVT